MDSLAVARTRSIQIYNSLMRISVASKTALAMAAVTFRARRLAPRLPKCHRRPGAVRVDLDLSAEVRGGEVLDIAIHTGNAPCGGSEILMISSTGRPVRAAWRSSRSYFPSVR